MIEDSVRAALLADSAVAASVGTRVYPLVFPQKSVTPAITYQRISTSEPVTMTRERGPARVRLQLDCWADTFDAVRALGLAVRDVLNGLRSDWLMGVFLESEAHRYEPDVKLWRVSTDYICLAQEAAA